MSKLEGHRAYVITATDRAGLVVIASTVLMSWMVLCFCIRFYTRTAITGPFKWDDLLAGLGTAVGVAQVGMTLKAVSNGLGKSNSLLSPSQLSDFQKDAYIADILMILGNGAAKTSIVFLLRRIQREQVFIHVCNVVLVLICIWIVGSAVGVSLRCDISHPWVLNDRCRDVILRWLVVTATDVLIEVILFGMSVSLIWDLHMRWTDKAIVVGAFGSRLLVIAASIVRFLYVRVAMQSEDPSLAETDATICSQILLHYSLMAATIPCLKPFVIAFNTGWGQGLSTDGSGYHFYKKSTLHTIQNSAGSSRLPKTQDTDALATTTCCCDPDDHVCLATGAETSVYLSDRAESMMSIDSSTADSQRMITRDSRGWIMEAGCVFEMQPVDRNR